MKADLHMHSYYSDGAYPPAVLADYARKAGAEAVALSDHDTLDGIDEMNAACESLGIVNVPAVEISSFETCDVHILGYNIDPRRADLRAFLSEMETAKIQRIGRILDKLRVHGMPLELGDVRKFARSSLSRGHVARAVVERGWAASIQECFDRWLYEGGPCHVPNTKARPSEVVRLIHTAGGTAVLAHPIRLKLDDGAKAAYVRKLAAEGLDGIEASYKQSPPERTAFFTGLAKENGLFVTNGGDFHNAERNTICPRPLSEAAARALHLL